MEANLKRKEMRARQFKTNVSPLSTENEPPNFSKNAVLAQNDEYVQGHAEMLLVQIFQQRRRWS